jgi:hypothetical protein
MISGATRITAVVISLTYDYDTHHGTLTKEKA